MTATRMAVSCLFSRGGSAPMCLPCESGRSRASCAGRSVVALAPVAGLVLASGVAVAPDGRWLRGARRCARASARRGSPIVYRDEIFRRGDRAGDYVIGLALGARRCGTSCRPLESAPLRQARRLAPVRRQHRPRRLRPERGIRDRDEDAALSEEPPPARAPARDVALEASRRALGDAVICLPREQRAGARSSTVASGSSARAICASGSRRGATGRSTRSSLSARSRRRSPGVSTQRSVPRLQASRRNTAVRHRDG